MKIYILVSLMLIMMAGIVTAMSSPILHYDCESDYVNNGALPEHTLATVGTGQTFNTVSPKLGSGSCNFTADGSAGTTNETGLPLGNANVSFAYWINHRVAIVYPLGLGTAAATGKMYSAEVDGSVYNIRGFLNDVTFAAGTGTHLNTWEHVVTVYHPNQTSQIYINGTLRDSGEHAAIQALEYSQTYDFCLNARAGDCTTLEATAQWDDIRVYNESLNQAGVDLLYNSGAGTELDNPEVDTIPNMDNTTWNLTSASGGNSTIWRTNQSYPIYTNDTTPTLTVSTDVNANCRLGVTDVNWTVMNSSRDCASTGSVNHTCTLSVQDELTLGSNPLYLYVACTALLNNTMSPLSTSGSLALNTTIPSSMVVGLFNTTYDNISTTLDEGQEFIVFTNYTYTENNTAVSTGWCNYTANNIINEKYNETIGTNLTVCTSGCDSTNKTYVFTDLHTSGFINDIYRFKLCKQGSVASKIVIISTNYSSSYTISYPSIPLCSNGYANISITDANSSGSSSLELSIYTDASISKALVLVDSFAGIDRLHNATENLTFHVPTQTFTGEEHEYYTHGAYNATINCYSEVSSNYSSLLDVTVVNVPPAIFVDTIWWWLLSTPMSFTPSIQARYPLLSGINVSGGCQDDDLQSAGVYLNYSNGTNIYSVTFLAVNNQVPNTVNFTQSNFSTHESFLNGSVEYSFSGWCNDTSNNISTVTRNFAAINLHPVSAWESSGGVILEHTNYSFNCSDPEGEVGTNYVLVNGTLNYSGSGPFVFDFVEGTYNLSVTCNDTFRNSTLDSITVTYVMGCIPQVFGVTDNARYRNNSVLLSANCSNGVSLTECKVFVNKYIGEVFECSGERIVLELGRQDLIVQVTDGTNYFNSSYVLYSKKMNDSGLGAYATVIFLVIALGILMIVYARYLKLGALAVLIGIGGFVLGTYLLAFSYWAAGLVMVGSVMFTLYEVVK